MKSARLSAALAAAAMMTGCGILSAGEESGVLQTSAAGQGTEFTQSLASEYQELSEFENDQSYDWRDADYYAAKSARAAQGEQVVPSDPTQWSIEEEALGELQSARTRLVSALDGGARTEMPETAARAQSQFDCWVEEQEEGWQMQNIAFCREQFELAMAELEEPVPTAAAPTTPPVTAPEPQMVRNFLVFFEFDEDQLTPEAEQVLRSAVESVDDWSQTSVTVTGHADRAGPTQYNMNLSERRAESVAQALTQLGVSPQDILTSAEGEADPLVPTDDGVAEPQNRRVRIDLQ